jgi:hypothetical protein
MGLRRAPVAVSATAALALLSILVATPEAVRAQQNRHSVGVGIQFQGYTFNEALGADVANLLLVPVAYRFPLGDRFRTDIYAAWGRGAVERGNRVFELEGPVDARIRASYQMSSWAVLTLGVNLPTGTAEHTGQEALVASVLSTDLLGFREANFGTGTAFTGGLATAHSMGPWGLGLAGSYRLAGEFEPRADTVLNYEPGNEIRIRAALDRTVGQDGKLTLGLTFQNFDADQVSGRNLFQAGNRFRADGAYSFRYGRSTWTAYLADVYREQGDATLDLVDSQGQVVGDTVVTTGTQNLFTAGLAGSVPVTGTYRVRPSLEIRVQSREESQGSGWLLGAGGDVPLRLFRSLDVFPRGRLLVGEIEDARGLRQGFWGAELGLTVRYSLR